MVSLYKLSKLLNSNFYKLIIGRLIMRKSFSELRDIKEKNKKFQDERNKKPKPRFEQEVYPSKDGKSYVGAVSEIVFIDRCFDPNKEDGSNGLISTMEHPKILDKQVDENGISKVPKGFQGYHEAVVWESCALAANENCPICDGRVAKANKVVYHKQSDERTKNKSRLHLYMTIIELDPKKYNKETKTLEPIKNSDGKPYKMFKKLLPLDFDTKGSTANRIIEVLLDAFSEINPETGKPYNSIRGVKLLLKRADDKMSHKIGEPKRYDSEKKGIGLKYKRLTEEELVELCGYTENRVDGETKRYSNAEPFDYEKVLPIKTEEELCLKYNVPYNKPVGKGDNNHTFNNKSNDDDDSNGDKFLEDVMDEDFNFDDDIPFD